jgi:AcrR family transcriptional regulator
MMNLNQKPVDKKAREDEIRDIAETAFVQKGFEHTSMDEIAAKAALTKRTIYKYYSSKEDLYYAVVLKGLLELMEDFENAAEEGETGLEKLRGIGAAYTRFFLEKPAAFRLINYSTFIPQPVEKSTAFREITRLGGHLFETFARCMKEGKQDGSIRADLDDTSGVFALYFLVTGFFFRLAEAGPVYFARYGLDPEGMGAAGMDLLMQAIQKK